MTQLEIIITVIVLLGLSIVCLLGLSYMYICIAQSKNRYAAWEALSREKIRQIKGKPTIPPKEGWDDINVPMR